LIPSPHLSKFTIGCRVSKFPSHSPRKKVEMKLGKKTSVQGTWLEKVARSEMMGRGQILHDPARIGRLSAIDPVVSLKTVGLHLSYMQEKYKAEYHRM
jgi:hypothetical protein